MVCLGLDHVSLLFIQSKYELHESVTEVTHVRLTLFLPIVLAQVWLMRFMSICAGKSRASESVGANQPDKRYAAELAAVLQECWSDNSVATREGLRP